MATDINDPTLNPPASDETMVPVIVGIVLAIVLFFIFWLISIYRGW